MLHRLTAAARRALMRAAALLARLSGLPNPHTAIDGLMYRLRHPQLADNDLFDSMLSLLSARGFEGPREEDFVPCEGCGWYFLPPELNADDECDECVPVVHADVARAARRR